MSDALRSYAGYLDSIGHTCHTRNGFTVRFSLTNTDCAWIDVRIQDGEVRVWDYFGTCYTGIRAANRLCRELSNLYPQYHVWLDKYTGFEIGVEETFLFTTAEEVHRHVSALAAAVDAGIPVGKGMLGDSFER